MGKVGNAKSNPSEEKIKNSAELFRQIFENSSEGIVAINRDGRLLFANEAVARNLGYSREEFLKLNITDIEAVESKADFEKHFADMLEGKRLRFETRHRRKDGSLMDVEVQLSVFDFNGKTISYSFWQDITERKRLEEKLRVSEDKYRGLVEDLNDVIYSADRDGVTTYISPVIELYSGYRPSEIIGRHFLDFIHPDDRFKALDYFQKNLQGIHEPFDIRFLSKSGEIVWAYVNNKPVLKEGQIVGWQGLLSNITERKRMEEALKNEHDRLIRIMDTMADGVCIVNQEYNIEYVNPMLEKEFGPISGNKCYAYFHDRTEVCPWCRNKEVFAGNTVRWEGYSFKNQKTYDLIAAPLKNLDGSISKLGLFRDTTERKKMEATLRESEKKYSTLVERSNDGIIIIQDGVLKFANLEISKITGIPVKDALGQPSTNFVHPEYRALVSERYKKRIAGEEVPNRYEIALLSGDGEKILGEVNASLIEYEGKPAVMAIFRDITERKKLEEVLKNEHDRLIRILDTMADGVCIFSGDYDIEYTNPVIFKEFGPVEGRKCYEYFHDRKEICPWCPNKEVFSGQTVRWEWYSFKNQKTYDLIDAPLKKPDGSVVKLQLFRDVTERKKMEEALQDSEEKYRRLFENTSNGIVIFDSETLRFEDVNTACLNLYSYTKEEFLSLSPLDVSAEVEKSRISVQKGLDSELTHIPLRYHRKKDGTVFPVEIFAGAFFHKGRKKGIGVIFDLTERMRAEEELRQAYKELREKSENLERFNRLMVGRELKMVELKKEVNELLEKLGQSKKYKVPDKTDSV